MTMTREEVERLLAGATPGKRVQFHGSYCKEAEGTPFTDWDTSHEMSVIRPDGSRYRLAHYKHAADAYLSQMAPDLARALLATMSELEQVKGERDGFYNDWDAALKIANRTAEIMVKMGADRLASKARAEAAETALAAMTARVTEAAAAWNAFKIANTTAEHFNAVARLDATLAEPPAAPETGGA